MFKDIVESKPYDPLRLLQDCLDRLATQSDVTITKTSVENFYTKLAELPDGYNAELEDINDACVACVGGTFRSPRMARYLRQKGVKLADNTCLNGLPISQLPELIADANVTSEGLIHPRGFNMPIRNLFIGLDTQDEDCQGVILFCTMNALLKKQNGHEGKIKLKIYVIDGDETESADLHRTYRAYDPDLDDPNISYPPAFPSDI